MRTLGATLSFCGLVLGGLATSAPLGLAERDRASEIAALEKAYQKTHRSYLRSLYEAQKAAQEDHLKSLKAWKTKASSKGHQKLVKEIENKIKALEAKIKKESAALKGKLKNVAPFKFEADHTATATSGETPPSPDPELKTVRVGLADADFSGGVTFDPKHRDLRGWQSGQAAAKFTVELVENTTYRVDLTYSSVENGRLRVAISDKKFLPDLKHTKGFDKSATVQFGRFTSEAAAATLTISLPLHRSREFVHVKGLKLVPQKTSES